jgi:hypothetical protein
MMEPDESVILVDLKVGDLYKKRKMIGRPRHDPGLAHYRT